MKTIALRFGEHFSPDCGTIAAHQQLIDELGYVWYGKMGNPVAACIMEELRDQDDTKILLINSGKADRYWAHVAEIIKETPPEEGIPEYYRDMSDKFLNCFRMRRTYSSSLNFARSAIVLLSTPEVSLPVFFFIVLYASLIFSSLSMISIRWLKVLSFLLSAYSLSKVPSMS